MKFVRHAFRLSFRVLAVWACFVAWVLVGSQVPAVGYAAYIFPFVVAAWIFRARLARRFPALGRLMARYPRRAKHQFEHAFKDEVGDDGDPEQRQRQWRVSHGVGV